MSQARLRIGFMHSASHLRPKGPLTEFVRDAL